MRIAVTTVALCLLLIAGKAVAVQVETFSTSNKESKDVALVEAQSAFPYEFEVEGTYAGDGDIERGEHGDLFIRDFHESQARVRFVLTPMTKIGILRIGLQTERYSFSFGDVAAVPDVLHSTNLIIGLDTELADNVLVRVEASPGFYGTDFDDFGRDTFNVPVVIGGTYIYSSTLQFIFGLGIDALRDNPVLPGGGVRWKFAPQWTVNAVVPTPRLEYEPNSSLLLYLGADIRATSYRVEKNFGTLRGNPALNHAAITYAELRAGGGFEWKLSSAVKLTLEAGAIPYRNFDFHRTQVRYHQDGIVPYGMIALRAAF
jgi:hypothetical protein